MGRLKSGLVVVHFSVGPHVSEGLDLFDRVLQVTLLFQERMSET